MNEKDDNCWRGLLRMDRRCRKGQGLSEHVAVAVGRARDTYSAVSGHGQARECSHRPGHPTPARERAPYLDASRRAISLDLCSIESRATSMRSRNPMG
jgi:hypothetical protein